MCLAKFMKDDDEMKAWISAASYEQLLYRWRFAPVGSPWLRGEVGEHFSKTMFGKRDAMGAAAAVAASKSVGWERGTLSRALDNNPHDDS